MNDTGNRWAPYQPARDMPWNLHRVVHLHRRAGFAATRPEVERDLRDGPEASIDRFLNGQAHTTGVRSDHEALAGHIGDAAVDSRQAERIKAWWVFRMLASPDPLGERLALMWHNHFATSNRKVDDLGAMRRQNELFRRSACARFGDLLNEVMRDPALLIWLDAPANRKGHPNENLARELMELFTLGIGHFDEADVKEAARALTGWTLHQGSFVANAATHDAAEKTLLGKSGRWNGADLIRILLDHPATARRLAGRLCDTFLGEGAAAPDDVNALAQGLRLRQLDIGWGVATILRSRAFFATENLGARVVGPVEFVVGAVRALECLEPLPSTLLLAEWITRIGQDLFYPPNVGGWPGGRTWLSTRGMIARANFASALVSGRELGVDEPPDILRLAGLDRRENDLDRVVACLAGRLLGTDPGPEWRKSVAEAARAGSSSLSEAARRAAGVSLASPEAQLG
jgi:uncharacterized protein (DUF1800 family)